MRIANLTIPYIGFLVIPALLWFLGYTSNALAIAANHGFMPVQGYTECIGGTAFERGDYIHVCMDKNSRLKILCDWVYTPYGTASLGDGLEVVGDYTFFPCLFMWLGFVIRDYSEDSWD
jgi:hypothetical protein